MLCLADQTDVVNLHLFIYRFAHVVNAEQRDGGANERFHFDARLRNCLRRALHIRALVRSDNVDLNFAERQGVTQRN